MRRLFLSVAVMTTLALPASIAAVTLSAPAGAASSVSCAKISGKITGVISIKKCTPKNKEKTLKGNAGLLAAGGTLTWNDKKTTIVGDISTTQPTPAQGDCKAGSQEFDTTGQVTGGTSTYTHAGDDLSSRTCVAGNNKISLVKGTSMTL